MDEFPKYDDQDDNIIFNKYKSFYTKQLMITAINENYCQRTLHLLMKHNPISYSSNINTKEQLEMNDEGESDDNGEEKINEQLEEKINEQLEVNSDGESDDNGEEKINERLEVNSDDEEKINEQLINVDKSNDSNTEFSKVPQLNKTFENFVNIYSQKIRQTCPNMDESNVMDIICNLWNNRPNTELF